MNFDFEGRVALKSVVIYFKTSLCVTDLPKIKRDIAPLKSEKKSFTGITAKSPKV